MSEYHKTLLAHVFRSRNIGWEHRFALRALCQELRGIYGYTCSVR